VDPSQNGLKRRLKTCFIFVCQFTFRHDFYLTLFMIFSLNYRPNTDHQNLTNYILILLDPKNKDNMKENCKEKLIPFIQGVRFFSLLSFIFLPILQIQDNSLTSYSPLWKHLHRLRLRVSHRMRMMGEGPRRRRRRRGREEIVNMKKKRDREGEGEGRRGGKGGGGMRTIIQGRKRRGGGGEEERMIEGGILDMMIEEGRGGGEEGDQAEISITIPTITTTEMEAVQDITISPPLHIFLSLLLLLPLST